ncbi:MAG: MFS transporter [Candidatus Diapherotrites archaeon]|nr:MFS transporter [Candidatus Diapherotrites archaeon]
MSSKLFKHSYFPSSLIFGEVLALNLFNWFAALFLIDLGMTGMEIGVLLSVFLATALFTTLPFGYLSDCFQLKRMVSFGIACLILFFVGLTYFTSFPMLLAFFFVGGVGANLFKTSIRAFIFKALDHHKEGFELGILEFVSVFATAIAGVFGGYLLMGFSFGDIFPISLLVLAIVFLASFFLDKNVLHKPRVREYRGDVSHKIVIVLAVVFFLYSFHGAADDISAPIVFRDVIGMNMIEVGYALGGVLFLAALFSLYLGKRFDKFHHFSKWALFFGLLLSSGGHFLLSTATSFLEVMAYRVIHTLGDISVSVFMLTEVAHLFSKKRIGGDYSLFLFVAIIAGAAGRLVIGTVGEIIGYQQTFLITGSLTLLGALIILATHEEF